MGDPEASDYIGPLEFADLEVCYPAECFCFDPLGEVVSDYQKEDLLSRCHREFTIMSMPHFQKDHGELMDLRFSRGSLKTGVCL